MYSDFFISYAAFVLCQVQHPGIVYSIVSSYSLHNRHLPSIRPLRIFVIIIITIVIITVTLISFHRLGFIISSNSQLIL
jgi:hypothetical protein